MIDKLSHVVLLMGFCVRLYLVHAYPHIIQSFLFSVCGYRYYVFFFFLIDPAPPEFYPLPLHAALPICMGAPSVGGVGGPCRGPPFPPVLSRPARRTVRLIARRFAVEWQVVRKLRLFVVRHGETAWSRDRKSTRLNSSHSQISYAVFCLK